MNARSSISLVLVAVLAGAVGWFGARHSTPVDRIATTTGAPRRIKFYQSAMHPWIKSDQPGKCRICGMDLVPIYGGDQAWDVGSNLVALTPAGASVVRVQTTEARQAPLVRTLRVAGTIEDDMTRHRYIAARVGGRSSTSTFTRPAWQSPPVRRLPRCTVPTS
jgi:Cu(I)/Ag(I) efflux system membrane fusion protein